MYHCKKNSFSYWTLTVNSKIFKAQGFRFTQQTTNISLWNNSWNFQLQMNSYLCYHATKICCLLIFLSWILIITIENQNSLDVFFCPPVINFLGMRYLQNHKGLEIENLMNCCSKASILGNAKRLFHTLLTFVPHPF